MGLGGMGLNHGLNVDRLGYGDASVNNKSWRMEMGTQSVQI